MPSIKNNLSTTFRLRSIKALVRYTASKYRPLDPGQYLYKLVTDFSDTNKFSEKFIALVYTTLIAWNMNQRGAKLSRFDIFSKSILRNRKIIQSLARFRIDTLENDQLVISKVKVLYDDLCLVSRGKPKLVTFSKTLHYFLPNLLMPIDRRYTLAFFYNNQSVPKNEEKQFQMYTDIFQEFRQLSKDNNLRKFIDDSWNRNVPKIIDNILIAHMKQKS